MVVSHSWTPLPSQLGLGPYLVTTGATDAAGLSNEFSGHGMTYDYFIINQAPQVTGFNYPYEMTVGVSGRIEVIVHDPDANLARVDWLVSVPGESPNVTALTVVDESMRQPGTLTYTVPLTFTPLVAGTYILYASPVDAGGLSHFGNSYFTASEGRVEIEAQAEFTRPTGSYSFPGLDMTVNNFNAFFFVASGSITTNNYVVVPRSEFLTAPPPLGPGDLAAEHNQLRGEVPRAGRLAALQQDKWRELVEGLRELVSVRHRVVGAQDWITTDLDFPDDLLKLGREQRVIWARLKAQQ